MDDIQVEGAALALAALRIIEPLEDEAELTVRYQKFSYNSSTGNWDPKPDGLYFTFLDCSDTFVWGSADGETVTEENLPILKSVIDDLHPLYKDAWKRFRGPEGTAQDEKMAAARTAWIAANPKLPPSQWRDTAECKALREEEIHPHMFAPVGDLFAARVRGMRPQGAAYKVRYNKALWPLFDACGPERETGFGNPKKAGE